MSKVRIRILWEDNGVTEQAREHAKTAARHVADQLPDGYVTYDGIERYDGPETRLTDRVGLANTVDEYIQSQYDPADVEDVVFCFLTEGNPFEYLEDAISSLTVSKLMGAGYASRTVGAPDEDYSYGLAVVNTYVESFVQAVPVPYDPANAVPVTTVHEIGHSLMSGVDAPTEHHLGTEKYAENGDHGVVTPMSYWYDHQLHTWANNPLEVEDTDVEPSDLTESTTAFSQRSRDEIVQHIDYWFS
ncbi:hypothetical protein [Halarchaeum sp. P4]|uniref:hypothetical protein n=1 Tax=Halarchaeum sp. P4 TaxID=3421639 RepID=UPI003EBC715C